MVKEWGGGSSTAWDGLWEGGFVMSFLVHCSKEQSRLWLEAKYLLSLLLEEEVQHSTCVRDT